MIRQHPVDLNPAAHRMEAIKITYPPAHSRRKAWQIEACRFIPHGGFSKFYLAEREFGGLFGENP